VPSAPPAAAELNGNDSDSDNDSQDALVLQRIALTVAFIRLNLHGPGITVSQFPALFEALGTTYAEVEEIDARALAALSDADGIVSLQRFSDWYIHWRFNDDDGSSDDEDSYHSITPQPVAVEQCATGAVTEAPAVEPSSTLQACAICQESFTATSFFTVPACGHQVTSVQYCLTHCSVDSFMKCSMRHLHCT
jgi:hypothetical protein